MSIYVLCAMASNRWRKKRESKGVDWKISVSDLSSAFATFGEVKNQAPLDLFKWSGSWHGMGHGALKIHATLCLTARREFLRTPGLKWL